MMIFTGNIELAEIHGLKNRSIDMHSHLLPSFDDGAGDIKETLNIIYEMKQKGLDALFWTPHLNLNSFSDITDESIMKHYEKYVDIIQEETGIELFYGSELFCSPPLPVGLVPLGKSDFILVEFPLDLFPVSLFDLIYNIQIGGFRVIMAHVERYHWLFPKKKRFLKTTIDYSLVEELKSKGVYFQINYQVLKNPKHYPFIKPILKDKKVEFIGSDNTMHMIRDP